MGGPQARAAYGASGSETKESRVPGSARTPAVLPVPGAALSSEEGLQHGRRWGYLSQVSSHSSLSQHVFEQAWKLPCGARQYAGLGGVGAGQASGCIRVSQKKYPFSYHKSPTIVVMMSRRKCNNEAYTR